MANLSDILMEYAQYRDEQQRAIEAKKAELQNSLPGFGALEEARQRAQLSRVRAALLDPERAKAYGEEADRLIREIRGLLAAHGYPENYLEPVHRCPLCRDTGYVGRKEKRLCSCVRKTLLMDAYAQSNLIDPLHQNFESFDLHVYDEELWPYMAKVHELCYSYAENFPHTEKKNLLFFGPTGVGKSYLLSCIVKRVLDEGHSAMKITAFNLFELFRSRHRGENVSLTPLVETELLALDDLGTEPMMNNITVEYLFNLLNERIQRGRHTLVATNLAPSQIKRHYGERLASRLINLEAAHVIRFEGRDLRLGKNQ